MSELIKNIDKSVAFVLADQVEIEAGRVNSRTLAQTPATKITLFAIDANEGMSSHSAAGDAMVNVLEGTAEITIDGTPHTVEAGQSIVIPANAPHAVRGITAFKMLLVVVIAA